MSVRSYSRPWVAALGLAVLSCGGKSPTGSTPPATTPPTATPANQPTPPPVQSLCTSLGYVSSPDARCARQSAGRFQTQVDAAIRQVIAEHGEIFENGSGGTRIKNFGKYVVEVVETLNGAGLCADFDGEEVQVKATNESNEQYDISSSSGYVRMGDPTYRSTCSPAAFPTEPPPPIPPPPGCSLPASRELACGSASASYLNDVFAAIDRVVEEHPELFDFRYTAKGSDDGYLVHDFDEYHAQVVAALVQRGYCARFDGEEIVLKISNEYSDHYDILTGEGYIRRGAGEYRVSCYPAAF